MTDAKTFLYQFTKDLVAHPMERQTIIDGWAKHLEARTQLAEQNVAEWFTPGVPEGWNTETWLVSARTSFDAAGKPTTHPTTLDKPAEAK